MRSLLTSIILCCLCLGSQARSAGFQKLAEVNKCWLEQHDVPSEIATPAAVRSEHDWIRYHLQLVERTLRARDLSGLSAGQAANRMARLDDLNAYWHTGRFPVNDRYSTRTPIFIDPYDNFCAVGYLLKASGSEAVSRKIAANTNLAYVREMRYPELRTWADANGFSVDELAWIQPGYPAMYGCESVGKGLDGEVRAMYADESAGRLYVGGDFTMADGNKPASYIAYVTENGGSFTWHAMGSGPGPFGPVQTIVPFQGKIFVGASTDRPATVISSAAYWDGTAWKYAGYTSGAILDMKVMGGDLYAAGSFYGTSASTVNFAKWNGSDWQPIPGLSGTVNTMHPAGDAMILGGDFSYQGKPLNVIQWNRNSGFSEFANGIAGEVRDFELFNDTLYAVCRLAAGADNTGLIVHLDKGRWSQLHLEHFMTGFQPNGDGLSVNTLFSDGNRLHLGGAFNYYPMMGHFGFGTLSLDALMQPTNGQWITVDSTVNAIVRFKDYTIHGGRFRSGLPAQWSGAKIDLNFIAARRTTPVSVPDTRAEGGFVLAPNPVRGEGRLRIRTGGEAGAFRITDLSGRTLLRGELEARAAQEILLPALTPGMYLLQLDGAGGVATRRFTVQ